jgi:hypothetical protein
MVEHRSLRVKRPMPARPRHVRGRALGAGGGQRRASASARVRRGCLEALPRYIAATYQGLKGEQIAEMVESAAGPEAEEVIVTWLEEIEVRGRKKGRTEILLTQLGARFGAVPAEARARVQAADDATLSRWAVRVLTATSIDDALADRRKTTAVRKSASPRKPAARAPARQR